LVAELDGISYQEARSQLEPGAASFAELEAQVNAMFSGEREFKVDESKIKIPESGIPLPPNTHLITSLPTDDYFRQTAENYLKEERRLPIEGKYVCGEKAIIHSTATGEDIDYSNRILIPYYDRWRKLIYWNARYLGKKKSAIRYLGPPKDIGIGKEDVVYMTDWPKPGEKLFLQEGELDADTIKLIGLPSAAFGGKEMNDLQAAIIRGYIPVLCLDNDSAGRAALKKIADSLLSQGFSEVYYVRPPQGYKDWNQLWVVSKNPKVIRAYILSNIQIYNAWEADKLEFDDLASYVCGKKRVKAEKKEWVKGKKV
jgi:hypothetical protein